MVDYHTTLRNSLTTATGLPVYYEAFLTKQVGTPCISYYEVNNYDTNIGDTIYYSRVSFIIKVWSNQISDLQSYTISIDEVMKVLGFYRVSANELFDPNSTMGQKILRYEALFVENENNI